MSKIYALLFLVMAIWGFNVSALATLVANVPAITLTAYRVLLAGIGVLIISYFMGIFRLPNKKELKVILIITIFNVVFHHSFLALGLARTSGVNAGIILGAAPLVTMVLSVILLSDRITRLRLLGFILGFIGIIVTSIVGENGLSSVSVGDLFIFISMFMQAISFILISKLNPDFDPRLLTGYMLVIGSVLIFIVAYGIEGDLSQITRIFNWKLGSVFLFSALIATAFGHMTYNYAVKNVGPAETAIFINLNTLFAIIGASIFLGEPILKNHYIGVVLILLGVFVGSGSLEYFIKKRKMKKQEPLR
ncbi:MAG TPA: DMT family transporter [Pseudogracilibacillus sp.]|nr:DMT family transporter [Pseudogracilibacillus sp.]